MLSEIRLTSEMVPSLIERRGGQFMTRDDYDLLIAEDATVYKPNGDLLLILQKEVIPHHLIKRAQPALRKAAKVTRNRGMAAGTAEETAGDERERMLTGRGVRYHPKKADGTISNTNYAAPAESGLVGYFERNIRFPYCRMTVFGQEHAAALAAALPMFWFIDGRFSRTLPDRHAAQMAVRRMTHSDFAIEGTAFTTVTVNRNFRTALHKDKGDLAAGFGVMTVMERGKWHGGHLVFPQFRTAVAVRHGDLLFADVHEWHGNTELVPLSKDWERLSLVLYFRERMTQCGSMEEELERAKNRQAGDPLFAGKRGANAGRSG